MYNYLNYFKLLKKKENLMIVLLDIAFLVLVFIFSSFSNSLVPSNLAGSSYGSMVFILLMLLVYYLFIIFIASLVKHYSVIFVSKVLDLKIKRNFWKLFSVNFLLFAIFAFFAIAINFVLGSLQTNYIKGYTSIILLPFLVLFYVFYSFTHSYFFRKKQGLGSIGEGLKLCFSRQWMELLVWNLVILVAVGLIQLALAYFINNGASSQSFIQIYNYANNTLSLAILYLLYFANRLYFFDNIKQKT